MFNSCMLLGGGDNGSRAFICVSDFNGHINLVMGFLQKTRKRRLLKKIFFCNAKKCKR